MSLEYYKKQMVDLRAKLQKEKDAARSILLLRYDALPLGVEANFTRRA